MQQRTLSCSANAHACVSLGFMPCRPAQLKALSSVQTKHQFVVQKEGPKGTSHMGVERDPNKRLAGNEACISGRKQIADHKPSRPARPHHRRLSDAVIHPIGEVDSVSSSGSLLSILWPRNRQIKHYLGSAVSERLHNRGGSTFLHLSVGVGDTLSVFHTLQRRTKTSCMRRMIASHAVPTHERTTLVASPELTRWTIICDLKVVTYCSQPSSSTTCSRKDFSLGVAHRPHVGRVVLPMLTNAVTFVLASAAQCPKHR